MIEELRSSLASLVPLYTGAMRSANSSPRNPNPLINRPTQESIVQNLKAEMQRIFNDFKTKLTTQLDELKKSQQLSSIMLIGNPINETITNLMNNINATLAYLDGINLDEFCKDFDTRIDGKLKMDGLMAEIETKINLAEISQTITNVNTQVLEAVRTTFTKQREELDKKITDVKAKLKELDALSFIPEIRDFIAANTSILEPARTCTHDQIDAHMRKLERIDFTKFENAKNKYKAEKKEFEDKKFGDLKTKLEELKTRVPALESLINPLLDSFKSFESPLEMSLETFEKDETKLVAPIEAAITDFVAQQANLANDLEPFYYAIEPSKLNGLNQLITELNAITGLTPEKLKKAIAIHQAAAEIHTDLKDKELLADDNKSHRLDSPNTQLVGELGAISADIIAERTEARDVTDKSSEHSMEMRLEMLRQRCAQLQGKDGKIEAHQRQIAVQRSALIHSKNQALFTQTTKEPENIAASLTRYENLKDEDWSATKKRDKDRQFKDVEKEIFNETNREKRQALLSKRKDILDNLQNKANHFNALAAVTNVQVYNGLFKEARQNHKVSKQKAEYQAAVKKTLIDLRNIDRKLLGKNRASVLYDNLITKVTPLLLGGTQVMIPQHLIDLQQTLEDAHNKLNHC